MAPADLIGLAAGAAICGVVSWVSIRRGIRARREAAARAVGMPAYAAHREWDFTPKDKRLLGLFDGEPFDQGTGRTATHVFRGRHGRRDFVAFDLGYLTRSGGGSYTRGVQHHHSVVAVRHGLTPDLTRPEVVRAMTLEGDPPWRLCGDWLLVTREGLHTPEEVEAKLVIIHALLDRFPR
ncbi:hypothetical protein F0U44_18105 [Nocardioides humilatus]|uniref:Uncharacterized protein n=1 Tax=Nocardioides humilatus TaxID=2607660 RepID=A0A5B1L9J9_9ACTN|nr:hypothetical protein [Nocardioides humilatus]KAA1417086.1 hypothetical protein F0U44_18105 [Nocardioides humilatus]